MKKCPKCGEEYKDTTTLCPSDGTVLKPTEDTLIGQTLAGKYRVDEFLSEGGMGTVYRGTHILMDKTVAIKVLHPALAADDIIVARFSREARAASRLSHPHALSVTDFGESEDGVVFLVMEFLNGRTLKEVVRGEGPMSLPRVVEIMRQVCGALEAAHAENVVHRDLKSDNIMLLDVGGGDWVKVLDFGIAKIQESGGQDPELTAPNLIIGTPQYMSPEQCSQASEIDSRSDIYSLGIILYEMLAGHVPFMGDSPTAVMMKHLQDEPPNLLDERSDVPQAVGQVVARTLSKKPEDRFQTAGELSESLALAAATEVTSETSASGGTERIERDTNRIVVPTGSNEAPRHTIEDEYDEETVVRPSPALVAPVEYEAVAPQPAPPPDNSNSWKLALIALAGVIVIGGVLYALMGSRPSAQDQQTPPLTVDPNSQPVQSAAPPTGQSEQGIAPNAPAPAANANANTSPNANTSDANQNQNSEIPLLPPSDINTNSNDNTQQNNNSSGNASNSNSNKNSNEGSNATPQATPPKVDVEPPPPLPTPAAKQQKKPQRAQPSTASPGGAAQQSPPTESNP